MRSVSRTSFVPYGGGGTMKSLLLTADPLTVATLILPEVADAGTVVPSAVEVALPMAAGVALNLSEFRFAVVSKFVPLTVTLVPATSVVGEKLEIVGEEDAKTVNDVALVAFPEGVVTAMEPVVAVAGTLVTIWVMLELVTVAVTPLNVTVF
jgi:hypothetical protein